MSSRNIRNKRAGLDVPKYSAQRLAGTLSLHDPGPNVHNDEQLQLGSLLCHAATGPPFRERYPYFIADLDLVAASQYPAVCVVNDAVTTVEDRPRIEMGKMSALALQTYRELFQTNAHRPAQA